mmetsp:Transcript_89426/g.224885  ORF Transcript_89426/g.224885 Transcript_89426/m.224885 type:complete len:213 (-) Transcript_89426:32-670(-)
MVTDEPLALHLVPAELADVACLHAGPHAKLVGVLLGEVEKHRQLWVVELVVRREGELDGVPFGLGVAVLPHHSQELLRGDVHVALHHQAALGPLHEGLKCLRPALLIGHNLQVADEQRNLLGEARKVLPLRQRDQEVVPLHTVLARLHNVVLCHVRATGAAEHGQRDVPEVAPKCRGSHDGDALPLQLEGSAGVRHSKHGSEIQAVGSSQGS